MNSKRCLLFVVDALSERIVRRQLDSGHLPNLGRLIAGGGKLKQCLSIFPSITPAATCSIVTGCYPAQHEIEGACWFDRERSEIAYFGDDLEFTMERGLRDFFVDFADHLNYELLACPTLFQTLHENGVDSACVNFMWFAGPHNHERRTPFLLRAMAGKLDEHISGPKYLKIGEFVEALPEGVEKSAQRSIFSRYGFNDQTTGEVLLNLAKANLLPPFTLGYFPNNDFQSHQDGPSESARQVLQPFDDFLGEMVEALGGWQRLGNDIEILIVGDHSQTGFGPDGPKPILIDKCLSQFQQSNPGNGWREGDEIFVCPNMRSTAIFLRDPTDQDLQRRIVSRLLAEAQIDQVIFETPDGMRNVETSDRGGLAFCKASKDRPANTVDDYGADWHFKGDLETIDSIVDSKGRIVDDGYPNPLERIDGAFVNGSFPIWVTARPDSEFRVDGTGTHKGGSHGALNFDDSETALITTAGVPLHLLTNSERPRITDVAPLCHHVLDVPRDGSRRKSKRRTSVPVGSTDGPR